MWDFEDFMRFNFFLQVIAEFFLLCFGFALVFYTLLSREANVCSIANVSSNYTYPYNYNYSFRAKDVDDNWKSLSDFIVK